MKNGGRIPFGQLKSSPREKYYLGRECCFGEGVLFFEGFTTISMAFTFIPAPGGKRGVKCVLFYVFFWKFHVFFGKTSFIDMSAPQKGANKNRSKGKWDRNMRWTEKTTLCKIVLRRRLE